MHKLIRAYGNWVTGTSFWDRESELRHFMQALTEGANILLVAPRRIGKTSLMREAARRMGEDNICLHVDLQKCVSAADAIAELSLATQPHASVWGKTKRIFANVFDQVANRVESVNVYDTGITLRSGLNAGNWQQKGDQVFETLSNTERHVIIFLDEVPILVNRLLQGDDYKMTPERRRQADEFMSWLRQNSLRFKGKVSIVVTGSIGIEPVLRQAGLSATLNTFSPFELEAWSGEVAVGCIQALATQYDIEINNEVAHHMVDVLGYAIPHHVQMFFDKVYEECGRRDDRRVTIELADEVYKTGMLSVRGHVELSHMEERLKMVLGPHVHSLTLEFLTEAAVVGQLTNSAAQLLAADHFKLHSGPDIVREILGILEHDGYLQNQEGRFVFRSKLLKDWWRTRFAFGFVPAAERIGGDK